MSSKRSKTDPNDVLLELAVAFGQGILREDCSFDKSAIAMFKKIFSATVAKGMSEKPGLWKEPGRTYVFKVVGKIARCACSTAKHRNQGLISGEILEECALEQIAKEKQVCGYAAEAPERSLAWRRVGWGDFCPD